MISLLSKGCVLVGAAILVAALVPVRRLIRHLPPGLIRQRWYAMAAMILLFIAGYLAYAALFWSSHVALVDLIVPAIFFFGACFVWLSATLSLQTTVDLMRVSVLERETLTDPLTGVFNRRLLDRRLNEEIARARRYGLPLSILLIDIDHFKQINDSHGHQAGDRVLIAMGKLIAKGLRDSDVVVRYGGEEFLIIAPHTPLVGAVELAERIRKRVASHDFALASPPATPSPLGVTVSLGIGSLGDGVASADELIEAADANLYRAKRAGRNRVVAAAPGGAERAQ